MWKLIALVLICCHMMRSDVLAYSKVSRNGQARANAKDVAFTVAPIYLATPKTIDLRPGEAVNHPSTPNYSTLDEEMVAKLDEALSRSRAQDRFHPPASFEHVIAHSSALKQQSASSDSSPAGSSSNSDVIYTKPSVSMSYDYPSFDTNSKPSSKPSKPSDSFPSYAKPKPADSFTSGFGSSSHPQPIPDYSNKIPTFDFDQPPKPIEFSSHLLEQSFDNPATYSYGPYHEEQVIYDQIPDDQQHDNHYDHYPYHPAPTKEPEVMDQRLNKRPYSYYYIGKKLWYIPLYFSIYFIIYIAALVLKSVARHKINFPANLAAAAEANSRSSASPGWTDYVVKVLESIESYSKKS